MTPLSVTALEDRLTPADVVVNYIIYFVDPATAAGLGTTGLTNGVGTTGFTNLGTTGFTNTGFGTSLGTNSVLAPGLGGTGLDPTGVGTTVFGNSGFGTTSLGLTGLGTGSLTNVGTGGVGPTTVVTGGSGISGTNLVGTPFGTAGLGTTGLGTTNLASGLTTTGFGTTTGGVFTGNGLNTVNRFNTINGVNTLGTNNGVNTLGSGLTPIVGSTGFALSGANGVTISTTITPTAIGTPTVTTTTAGRPTLAGTAGTTTTTVGGPTAQEVAAARASRAVIQSNNGRLGVLVNPFPGYGGELRTAVGDVTGDGVPDTVVAPGNGGGPRVAVIDGRTGTVVADFFAFDENLRNGLTVAAGDLDGDGRAEVVVGAGPGGGPRVKAFNLASVQPTQVADFFAFDPNFRGGVSVAVGDATGNGVNEILTGAGVGGGPRVDAFTAAGTPVRTLFAGDVNGRGGVDIAGAARAADGRLLLAAGGPTAGLYDAATGELVRPLGSASATPATVSLVNGSLVRVVRPGLEDSLFDLNGVAVG